MAYNHSPTLQNSTVEYNNSPHLQSATIDYSPSLQSSHDGSNYPINSPQNADPNVVYAVGPDGNPDLNNPIVYSVADNGTPVMGVPFDNPPTTMVSAPPPAQPFRMTKEIYIAIFGIIVVIIGGILLGVAKSSATSCVTGCEDDYVSTAYSYTDYYSSSYTSSYNDFVSCLKKCKSSYDAMRGSGIALMVIGAILLLGDGAFTYNQMMQVQQMQQQQMQQMQM